MKTICITTLLCLLAPSAWAATSPKPSSGSSSFAAQQQQRRGVFSFLKRKLVPFWKQRFQSRRQTQWNKPGGVNFPTPGVRKAYFDPRKKMKMKPTRRRGFWTRLRTAWRARWGNRHVAAKRKTALENQAGFGKNIHRRTSNVAYSWRNRFDNKRLKPKATPKPRRFKPRRRMHRPPPGW